MPTAQTEPGAHSVGLTFGPDTSAIGGVNNGKGGEQGHEC
jgi:hypothetical protein